MAEEEPDILAKVREKYPEYTSTDDTTLAVSLSKKFPEYRPYLRKYLTTYPVEAPATAASAAADLEASRHTAATALTQPPPWLMEAAKSVKNPVLGGAAEMGAEQITLANAGLGMGLAKAGATAATAASTTFGTMALKQMAEQAPEAYQKWQSGDRTGAIRELTKLGLTGILAALMGKHAVEGIRGTPAERVANSEADLQHSKIDLERASQEGDLASKQESHKNIKDVLGEGHEATETARRAVEQQQEVIDALNAATSAANTGSAPTGRILEKFATQAEARQALSKYYDLNGRPIDPAMKVNVQELEGSASGPYGIVDTAPVVDEMRPRDLPETVGTAPPVTGERGSVRPAQEGGAGGPVTPAEMDLANASPGFREMVQRRFADWEDLSPEERQKMLVRDRASQGGEGQPEVVQGANGEKVIPNQPPSPDAEAGLTTELSMRGVDTNDPQAMMDYHAEDLSQPATVRSVGDVPVSASYVGKKGYETDLADGAPSKVAHEVTHMAAEEGKLPPPPEGPGANDQVVADTLTRKTGDPVGAFNREAHDTNADLTTLASRLENSVFHREILADQTERIAEQGTIAPESRRQFQQGDDVDTKHLRVSMADQQQLVNDFIAASRKAKMLAAQVVGRGDGMSRAAAKVLWDQSKLADQQLDQIVKEIRVIRKAQGRMVDAWQRHPEIMDSIRAMANMSEHLRDAGLRKPILSNILLKDYTHASPAEKLQLTKDVVDLLRYTKFSVTSFTMDVATNGWNLGSMFAEGLGKDVGRAATGRLDFSNLRGWGRAMDDRFRPYFDKKSKPGMWKLRINRGSPEVREALGHTIQGEDIRGAGIKGPGAFTYREGIPITLKQNAEGVYVEPRGARFMHNATKALSIAVDNMAGGPMYAKGLVDRAAGELGAGASLWVDAIQNTPKELRGAAAYQWRRAFVDNPPPEFAEKAVEIGNKAKFNRELSPLEEHIAGSTTYRLTVDMFARWPFQFSRALMENLGADPVALKRIVGDIKAGRGLDASEHVGGYLTKSLAGLGGVYFLYNAMKDKFDAFSAMYEKDDGNGKRMSNMSPVPEAMFLGNLLEGSWRSTIEGKDAAEPYFAKAFALLKYTSFPGAKLATGGGGLLSSLIAGVADAQRNKVVNPRATEKVIVDAINTAIPGQAVLSALKSMSDDITREGFGANLPGVSLTLPASPNSATGEPLRQRQSYFGVELPQIRGSALPGATILRDPVTKILMKYGMKVYRNNRSPIAGVPANDLSPELQREWEFELGKQRQHTFHVFIEHPDMLEKMLPEQARDLVMKQDALAARDATRIIQINHGIVPKPFREPTARELTGPPELMKRYNEAKRLRAEAIGKAQEQ